MQGPSAAREPGDRYLIEVAPTLRPPWLADGRLIAPLAGPLESIDDGTALVTATSASGTRFGLVVDDVPERRVTFAVDESIDRIRGERYAGAELATSVVSRLPLPYWRAPMWLRTAGSRLLNSHADFAALPRFPAYPLDLSADVLAHVTGRSAPRWPTGKSYAVVLTHDVDSAWPCRGDGRRWLAAFRAAEEDLGARSAWYIVPTEFEGREELAVLGDLSAAGHELGVHGWTHDPGLADVPLPRLMSLLRAARERFSDLGAIGYRSPWLSRGPALFAALRAAGYRYDTSVPNADCQRRSRIANNGCGTVFPHVRDGVLELPLTLPQDSMRMALGLEPAAFWHWLSTIAERISAVGGLVVVSTHIQPHHSATPQMLAGYRSLIAWLIADPRAWLALPREVAAWSERV